MPNIGVKIGQSVTCLCAGALATGDDLRCADLFSCLGKLEKLAKVMMNESTAISGSGPGYIFEYFDSEGISDNAITENVKENIISRLAQAAEGVVLIKTRLCF